MLTATREIVINVSQWLSCASSYGAARFPSFPQGTEGVHEVTRHAIDHRNVKAKTGVSIGGVYAGFDTRNASVEVLVQVRTGLK